MHVRVGRCAGHRCDKREAETPSGRHDQDTEQEDRAERGIGGDLFEQMHHEHLGGDEAARDRDTPPQRWSAGPEHRGGEPVAPRTAIGTELCS